MRAAYVKSGAGIAAIRVTETSAPQAGPGEALVRMTAATLNYRDIIMAKGLIPGLAKEPELIPLSCAAAEVVAVGQGVTRVKVGDRVSPLYGQGWLDGPVNPDEMLGGTVDGVARELAAFDAQSLVLLPDELSDLEAGDPAGCGADGVDGAFRRAPAPTG
jgi:NADPH:quinone reductase-like Zn-dependent oxidoreductase